MNNNFLKKIFLFILVLLCFPGFSGENINSKQIMEKMFTAIQALQTARYTLNISERIKGVNHNAVSVVKLNANPRKLYIKNPGKGTEILWVQGENKGNAWVYPNGFPYATLSLSPTGDIMRKNQHHTLQDLGFLYIAKIVKNSIFKTTEPFEKVFTYIGDIIWEDIDCYKVFANFSDFKYVNYKVEKGETISSVAAKFNCGEYRILEKNTWINDYTQNIEGKTIFLPNNYSAKTLVYVSKKNMLPVFLKVYDDQGFYEGYEYRDLRANVPIADEEFRKDYKDYKF